MTEYVAKRSRKRMPTHPGALLSSTVLPALGKSKTEIAELLGVSRPTLYDILACKKPITPQMAVRFGKLCGNGPEIWIKMQATYDLWQAQQVVDVSDIPTLVPA